MAIQGWVEVGLTPALLWLKGRKERVGHVDVVGHDQEVLF
jgi:hypothetical protein